MRVVAFSYSIGSFGKLIAMEVARIMNLRFVSFSEIYKRGLKLSSSFRRRQKELDEGRGDVDIWEGHFFSHHDSSSLFSAIIYEMASEGEVLLMGHGVQAFLSPYEGVLRVHVTAPLETRINRFMEFNKVTVQEASQTVQWWDQRQKALFELCSFVMGCDYDYDLVINTARLNVESAAKAVADSLPERPDAAARQAWTAKLQAMARAKRVECAVRESAGAIGLAPLEVHPLEGEEEDLLLSGFVHTEKGRDTAMAVAREAAGDSKVKSLLKVMRLHQDLLPPRSVNKLSHGSA